MSEHIVSPKLYFSIFFALMFFTILTVVAAYFDLLAETAVKETKKNGEFTIPGIGKLVKAERKARLGRNPQTGETIKIKAKTVVKFRVAKAAKDAIAPAK